MVGATIKSLVLQGKRVIIPEFGAFLIKDTTVNPLIVKDNVTFSPFLRYNDGFLENELAHAHGMHKDEASVKVAEFVALIKRSIYDDNALFQIDGLGFFYKDPRGNASFSIDDPSVILEVSQPKATSQEVPTKVVEEVHKPFSSVIEETKVEPAPATPASVQAPPQPAAQHSEPVVDRPVAQPTPEPAKPRIVESTPSEKRSVQTGRTDTATITATEKADGSVKKDDTSAVHINNVPPSRKFSRGLLFSFLGLLVALFVLNMFWSDIFGASGDRSKPQIVLDPMDQEEVSKAKEKVEAKEQVQQAISDEVVATVEQSVKASSKPKKAPDEAKPTAEKKADAASTKAEPAKKGDAKAAASQPAKSGTDSYAIIHGSFSTAENANKMVKELAKKGVKAVVVSRNKMSSVVSGDFKTYEAAQKELNRVKALGIDGFISKR